MQMGKSTNQQIGNPALPVCLFVYFVIWDSIWRKRMKLWSMVLILVLVAGVLAGCGGSAGGSESGGRSAGSVDTTSGQESAVQELESSAEDESDTSTVLVVSYDRALPASSQLALGTFQLQGTENAVTPEQAKTLLPLWQAIQGGSLQSNAETNAVLKQVEGAMTAEQLAAIAALQLTFDDMGAWMQEQGVQFRPQQGVGGGQGPLANMSEEERASIRATRQAGGGGPGQGGGAGRFADMNEEEREAMRATAEGSGMTFGGRGGARTGQIALLAEPLVEFLTRIVAE
jgi:hypothetical protein